MNLIMEADCFSDDPVVSDPVGIDALVRAGMAKMKTIGPNPPPGAGRLYAKWAKGINDNIEERDANLVMHRVRTPPRGLVWKSANWPTEEFRCQDERIELFACL